MSSLSRGQLLARLKASLTLIGMEDAEAAKISASQCRVIFKEFQGQKIYFQKGRKSPKQFNNEAERRAIYLEWWTNRPTGPDLQEFLARHDLTATRLEQIADEGRKRKWAA